MPLSVNMVVTPVTASPLMMLQLIGALPRCLGSSEECTLIVPSGGISRISWESSWPNAAVTHRSGAQDLSMATPSSRLMRSGWKTGMPALWASSFTGQAASLCPRPFGRSGWQKTPTTS